MPATMVAAALGNSTFQSSCMGVAPKDCPASMSGRGTDEMPKCVNRIGAGSAKMTVEMSPGTTPRPNSTSVGMRYTKVGKVCMRSSTGRMEEERRGDERRERKRAVQNEGEEGSAQNEKRRGDRAQQRRKSIDAASHELRDAVKEQCAVGLDVLNHDGCGVANWHLV